MKTVAFFGLFLSTAIAASVSEDILIGAEDETFGNTSVVQDLIYNGKAAAPGQFPYQVGLSLTLSGGIRTICGGSVISNSWVLTAAHCIYLAKGATLYFGSIKRLESSTVRLATVRNFHMHPNYDHNRIMNDIALISIDYVAFSSYINKVRIPPLSSRNNYMGESAVISGWGYLGDPRGQKIQRAQHLQFGQVKVINNNICAYTYGNEQVQDSKICVLTDLLSSPCGGDSGSPLVSNNVQIGLMSFGDKETCSKGFPVVFTRLTSYLPWIKSVSGVSY